MDSKTNPLGIKKIDVPTRLAPSSVVGKAEMIALGDAMAIVQAGHARAKEMIDSAGVEAEKIRTEVRNSTAGEVWREAQSLLQDLRLLREEMLEQSVEVAQSILQKAWEILCGDLSQSEKLRCALEQAGRYFVSTSAMTIRVNPDCVPEARNWIETRRQAQAGLELMTIEADSSVRPDEVRLYLDRGGVIRADFVGTIEILKAQWS